MKRGSKKGKKQVVTSNENISQEIIKNDTVESILLEGSLLMSSQA